MIYTLTFNPSLDYMVSVEHFELGMTNRADSEQIVPGGKGINVSLVLNNLGIENTALGFVAGFTGREILRRLEALGVRLDFIPAQRGFSRINVKLKNYDGTEINGRGPALGEEELRQLTERLDRLEKGDFLVLAGSVPQGLPDTVYQDIMERLQVRGVLFVVDATGQLLLHVLKYRPFLIKPNHHELGALFRVKLDTRESVVPYAKRLQAKGARNVLVSMAGSGAVLCDEAGGIHQLAAPEGRLVNAVGAGDSMVAGFLAGWHEKGDYEYAFRMGVAAGSASAFSEGLAEEDEIRRLYAAML